jgi:hypothetical protein
MFMMESRPRKGRKLKIMMIQIKSWPPQPPGEAFSPLGPADAELQGLTEESKTPILLISNMSS